MPVYKASTSDAQFISNMFTSNSIKGNSVSGRLLNILIGVHSYPKGFMAGDFGSSGFNDSLQDQGHYDLDDGDWKEWLDNKPYQSDQVGHFLTAVGFGFRSVGNQYSALDKHFAIAHELHGDNVPTVLQVMTLKTIEGSIYFEQARQAFANGEENWDAPLHKIYDLNSDIIENRPGNSIEDLRLTVIGWQFGRMVARGEFATRQDAADWLKKYLQ